MRPTLCLATVLITLLAAPLVVGEDENPRPAHRLQHDARQATVDRVPAKRRADDDSLRLTLRIPMPDPGWKLETRSVSTPDEEKRIRVVLTAERLPDAWPAMITDLEHEIEFPALLEGTYLLDIWITEPVQGLQRAGATIFRAYGKP